MSDSANTPYTVVARRYRPQAFSELVGQPHVITALTNAIEQHRVGHAYLFTGARGVGKTSTARIFAKCLNCQEGPTTTPCNECDVCISVAAGEDVDVLEIDGASNRGIDEIRQLRSNVNIRPSRCRFKIYIIDEVHMLTTPAFNALLKTLEEPPPHVKFLFCTTDPQKIPITVLSRCQRFDFAPVEADEISGRLREIAQAEGVEADDEALALIARRANGSMRDSQSLLEQILSLGDKKISVSDVHQLLGTADLSRVTSIVRAMLDKNLAMVLAEIDATIKSGTDVGQLSQQLVGYLRDMMAIKAGCDPKFLLTVSGAEINSLVELTQRTDLSTILSMLQVVDQAITRMQHSHHSRVLLEAAALRCCELESLQAIADLLSGVASPTAGKAATSADSTSPPPSRIQQSPPPSRIQPSPPPTEEPKKKVEAKLGQPSRTGNERETEPRQPPPAPPLSPLSAGSATKAALTINESAAAEEGTATANQPVAMTDVSADSPIDLEEAWRATLDEVGSMTADFAADFTVVQDLGNGRIQVVLRETYNATLCNRVERRSRFEAVLSKRLGRPITLEFQAQLTREDSAHEAPRKMSRRDRIRAASQNPYVKAALEIFSAEVTDVIENSPKK